MSIAIDVNYYSNWATDRINKMCNTSDKYKENIDNALSLYKEFEEWIDEEIDSSNVDVAYLTYVPLDDDD